MFKRHQQSELLIQNFFLSLILGHAFFSSLAAANTTLSHNDIAPIEIAITLAQVNFIDQDRTTIHTLLVVKDQSTFINAIDLTKQLQLSPDDPLDIFKTTTPEQLRSIYHSNHHLDVFEKKDLLISPAIKGKHIAAGANYAAHGAEAGIDTTFIFPKFSHPTGYGSIIQITPEVLLDYEIELCARFDRDIATAEDFQQSIKGIFLCGDFTDRAELLRKIDKNNVASGKGFADGKSGEGLFPTSPFTVIPNDWNTFINDIEMTLTVDGTVRQQAKGDAMLKKLDAIVNATLADKVSTRWDYKGINIPIITDERIKVGQAILTGTPEGVIFRPPSNLFRAKSAFKWLTSFSFLSSNIVDYVVNDYIDYKLNEKDHLQPGDDVHLNATYLGEIALKIQSK